MKTIFKQEYDKACKHPEITDKAGRLIFQGAFDKLTDKSEANTLYVLADEGRLGNPKEQHEAAFTYLALAFASLENNKLSPEIDGKIVDPGELFHFSGHAFREIGQLNRAGDAYWRAGVTSNKGRVPSVLGIRSIARAKVCYGEVGEYKKSDEMHCLEWEARRKTSPRCKPLLFIWAFTSMYGTAIGRWLVSIAITFIICTCVYELLHWRNFIHQGQAWTPVISAFYYCVVTMTTLGYGEFVPNHWFAQLFVVFNVIAGYALLGIGITILGRKVLGR